MDGLSKILLNFGDVILLLDLLVEIILNLLTSMNKRLVFAGYMAIQFPKDRAQQVNILFDFSRKMSYSAHLHSFHHLPTKTARQFLWQHVTPNVNTHLLLYQIKRRV